MNKKMQKPVNITQFLFLYTVAITEIKINVISNIIQILHIGMRNRAHSK